MKKSFAILLFLLASSAVFALETILVTLPDGIEKPRESHWRDALALVLKAQDETIQTEVICKGGRCDIVTAKYAIEVDRASKWHEAIGQACHYALVLNRKPAIALFNAETLSPEALEALKRLTSRRRIEVFFIQQKK